MKVAELSTALDVVAPVRFAAAWDNVGLLVGDPGAEVDRVLLCVDCTRAVLDEAVGGSYGAIVAYHPPIFDGQKRVVAGSIAYDAARAGVAVYSPHTAFDVAPGGTNDVLADALGMVGRTPLRPADARDAEYKLVTFVPAGHVEVVSEALFAAGAGKIGHYTSCSFRTTGTGTFFGEAGTHPTIGSAGRLEQADEIRLETVVPIAYADVVVRALRSAHPYEEPAFDLVRLAPSAAGRGFGRVGTVPRATVRGLVERTKHALGIGSVLVAGGLDREVTRAAVCAGSGGDLLPDAVAAGAQVFLTGELKHHDVLRAIASEVGAICLLHSVSERVALASLARLLLERVPGLHVAQSAEDREPFMFC
jgi:dinuclear metal center YbgI/SA1388 family protein